MSSSVGGTEFSPGQDLSVLQLLQAARKKLQDTLLGGRYVSGWPPSRVEITQVLQDYDDTEPERGEWNQGTVLCFCAMAETRLRF